MKKVSIVVPVFNTEKYLTACLNSISGQSYQNLEAIIVDDGSTDNSAELCKKYANKDVRFKYFYQKNNGVSSARNRGMQEMTGDYVMFVDSDDEIDKNMLETLVTVLEGNDAEVVSCGVNYIATDGALSREPENQDMEITEGEMVLKGFLKNEYGQSACARLYLVSTIKDITFSTGVKINEDKLFIYDVFSKTNKHVCLVAPMYSYRQIAGSSSHSKFSEKFFDIEFVADKMLNDVYRKFPKEKLYAEIQAIRSWMELYTLMTLSVVARTQYKDEYAQLRRKIVSSGFRDLDSRLATLRFFIICYVPFLYIPLAYLYDVLFRKERLL